MTINYTDRKVNFTKLLQCRNLYSWMISKEQNYQEFWDTELILKYGTWPVFVVERLIGLFKWVSRLWPNGTLANLLRTRVPEVYIFLWNISFNIFLPLYLITMIERNNNSKKNKIWYLSQLVIQRVTNNKKFYALFDILFKSLFDSLFQSICVKRICVKTVWIFD